MVKRVTEVVAVEVVGPLKRKRGIMVFLLRVVVSGFDRLFKFLFNTISLIFNFYKMSTHIEVTTLDGKSFCLLSSEIKVAVEIDSPAFLKDAPYEYDKPKVTRLVTLDLDENGENKTLLVIDTYSSIKKRLT